MLHCYLILLCIYTVQCNLYHEKSRIVFQPNLPATYFGYSILLRNSDRYELVVGAPKAIYSALNIAPGAVFSCPVNNVWDTTEVSCNAIKLSIENDYRMKTHFKDDMWMGSSIASINNGSILVVTAPRWTLPYREKHLLAIGMNYIISKRDQHVLLPLNVFSRLAYEPTFKRKEYADYTSALNFYAYGQGGMSIKVTDDESSLIMGAPGLLQWTGGVINYSLLSSVERSEISKQPIANPYLTMELGPDDYFGYSVESGKFEQNGKTLFVAGAPRSKLGFGQVLIFEPAEKEAQALTIKFSIQGPQLGSYFGGTLCAVDLDRDGITELLVGAPNYVESNGELPYDQGAVFVYKTFQNEMDLDLSRNISIQKMLDLKVAKSTALPTWRMEQVGYVTGSKNNGARFGTAIAVLGDVDNDGYSDVAIGAPYENDGSGAVYIYRGTRFGLHDKYVQKITVKDARGFGYSISKGLDVDWNGCNDLAIGAYKSAKAYIYRCIPTITVWNSIKVPNALDLPQNSTNFTAMFCIHVDEAKLWPHVKLDMIATVLVDPEEKRAQLSGSNQYKVTVSPGQNNCDEQVVEVNPHADLSRPISLSFHLKPDDEVRDSSLKFPEYSARASEISKFNTSLDVQLTRGCGEDLICIPTLVLNMTSLSGDPFIPGLTKKLGVKISVLNTAEPAYGYKMALVLPLSPIRLPGTCILENINMTCDLPSPLHRNESIIWDIEFDYHQKGIDEEVFVVGAKITEPLKLKFGNLSLEKSLELFVKPEANLNMTGKALPNNKVLVTRKVLYEEGYISFDHLIEISNSGPSDWPTLTTQISFDNKISLNNNLKECVQNNEAELECSWSISANGFLPVLLNLRFNLSDYGEILREKESLNLSTIVTLHQFNISTEVKTSLVLEAAAPIWPVIVGAISGFILLTIITYFMYKKGFFTRQRREELKKLQETESDIPIQPGVSEISIDESMQEQLLLSDDSE